VGVLAVSTKTPEPNSRSYRRQEGDDNPARVETASARAGASPRALVGEPHALPTYQTFVLVEEAAGDV
jgi:hypothetical protein